MHLRYRILFPADLFNTSKLCGPPIQRSRVSACECFTDISYHTSFGATSGAETFICDPRFHNPHHTNGNQFLRR
ncbi:hypothetical protein I552_7064 [Mycobacterium xenopi 3993]|nr:hypothetical protein I552_7064 [Mycobacterium xenopi 3993]